MEVAWVKVSNVPSNKRSERILVYVTFLVGVPLEIDVAMLHRPSSAHVKMGVEMWMRFLSLLRLSLVDISMISSMKLIRCW